MRGSAVLGSGACGYVHGTGKGNYSGFSKLCYPQCITTKGRAHLR